jgi:hypothetical protein
MKNSKRIWNNNELIIAYYVAKWDVNGLKMTEEELAEYVIGNTSAQSLKMQAANFRHLLGIEGYTLEDASQAQRDVVEQLKNSTVTQVRNMIFTYTDSVQEEFDARKASKTNKAVNEKRDQLNAQLQKDFEAQLKMKGMYRRLRKL